MESGGGGASNGASHGGAGGGGMDKQALQQLQSIQQLLKNPPPVQVEPRIMSSSTSSHSGIFHIWSFCSVPMSSDFEELALHSEHLEF